MMNITTIAWLGVGILAVGLIATWLGSVSTAPEPKSELEVVRVCDPGFAKLRGDKVVKDEEGRLWYVDRRGRKTLTTQGVIDEVCTAPKKGFFR
jgi:hypothetical protein